MTTRVSSRRPTSRSRRPADRQSREKGRRSRARLGRTYETVTVQPMRMRVGPGWMKRTGIKDHHVVGMLLLVVLAFILAYLFISPRYYVWDLSVGGNRWLTAEEVTEAAGVAASSIFYIDPGEIGQAVERLPIVAKAQVTCGLPNQVTIQVAERVPVAIWQNQGIQYWVDAEGVLFPRVTDLPDPIIIVEQGGVERRPGSRVDADAVSMALNVHRLVPEAAIFGYSAEEGMSFDLSSGLRVLVPADGNATRAIAALDRIRGYLNNEQIQAHLVDLRYQSRAVWR